MKALLIIAATTLLATSAFASTEKIDCTANSNSDYLMQIVVDSNSQILGASLYNQDWSQIPENTFKKTKAVGTTNPMAGITVILEDNQTLDIEYSVLSKGHNGTVILNDQDEYSCN